MATLPLEQRLALGRSKREVTVRLKAAVRLHAYALSPRAPSARAMTSEVSCF